MKKQKSNKNNETNNRQLIKNMNKYQIFVLK